MLLYQRNITNQLLYLRLSFFILGIACFAAFNDNYNNLGYCIAVALLFLSIISLKNLTIYTDSFLIEKYYCFGFIKRSWQFNKEDKLRLTSFGSSFGESGETPDHANDPVGLGCLYSVFSVFLPPTITKKPFKVAQLDELNTTLKSVTIILNKTEYNYFEVDYKNSGGEIKVLFIIFNSAK